MWLLDLHWMIFFPYEEIICWTTTTRLTIGNHAIINSTFSRAMLEGLPPSGELFQSRQLKRIHFEIKVICHMGWTLSLKRSEGWLWKKTLNGVAIQLVWNQRLIICKEGLDYQSLSLGTRLYKSHQRDSTIKVLPKGLSFTSLALGNQLSKSLLKESRFRVSP